MFNKDLSEKSEKKRVSSTLIAMFLGILTTLVLVVAALVWFIHWHIGDIVYADVCVKVVEYYPNNYIRMDVVRGYDEYWDKNLGTVIVVKNGNADLEIDDRLTVTSRSLYGEWDIDWEPYEECPEATVR